MLHSFSPLRRCNTQLDEGAGQGSPLSARRSRHRSKVSPDHLSLDSDLPHASSSSGTAPLRLSAVPSRSFQMALPTALQSLLDTSSGSTADVAIQANQLNDAYRRAQRMFQEAERNPSPPPSRQASRQLPADAVSSPGAHLRRTLEPEAPQPGSNPTADAGAGRPADPAGGRLDALEVFVQSHGSPGSAASQEHSPSASRAHSRPASGLSSLGMKFNRQLEEAAGTTALEWSPTGSPSHTGKAPRSAREYSPPAVPRCASPSALELTILPTPRGGANDASASPSAQPSMSRSPTSSSPHAPAPSSAASQARGLPSAVAGSNFPASCVDNPVFEVDEPGSSGSNVSNISGSNISGSPAASRSAVSTPASASGPSPSGRHPPAPFAPAGSPVGEGYTNESVSKVLARLALSGQPPEEATRPYIGMIFVNYHARIRNSDEFLDEDARETNRRICMQDSTMTLALRQQRRLELAADAAARNAQEAQEEAEQEDGCTAAACAGPTSDAQHQHTTPSSPTRAQLASSGPDCLYVEQPDGSFDIMFRLDTSVSEREGAAAAAVSEDVRLCERLDASDAGYQQALAAAPAAAASGEVPLTDAELAERLRQADQALQQAL